MERVYKRFITVEEDGAGHLVNIKFHLPENFNYGFDIMDAIAEKDPDKKAMVWVSKEGENKNFTFREIKEYSNRAANLFKSKGIKKGDRVLLVLKRHYQFWFSMLGLHKLGAVAIPATNQLMKKDFVYRFNAAGVSAVVATQDDDVPLHIEAALPDSPTLHTKFIVNGPTDGWEDFDALLMEQSPVFERPTGEDANLTTDPMLMYFTSGTTGYPKIATHSFDYGVGHFVTAYYWHNVDPDGIHFTISDTGWAKAAWGKLYGQWLCETCLMVYDFDRFHAEDILPLFKKYNITTFCAPPTMYRFFIQEDIGKYDLSSLKYCTIAGEALNPEVYNKWYQHTGIKLMEGFGQTETTLVIGNLFGMTPKPGSMGKPNPQYDIALVDPDGNEVPTGEVGEICIRTAKGKPVGLFTGYYRNEEKTKEAWYDGMYHTGDMAWRDEDGYFWYMSRTDDVIKSSGYRIGPFEIESVLMEHPSVVECAVTGVPDPLRGFAVKATIVLAKGYEPSEELKKELQKFVKDATAPYKYPRVVEFVKELPKTISGKIKRAEIRNSDQA